MALTQASLSLKIQDEIDNFFTITEPDLAEAFADALAKAVVDELKANGESTPGTFSNSGGPITGVGGIN